MRHRPAAVLLALLTLLLAPGEGWAQERPGPSLAEVARTAASFCDTLPPSGTSVRPPIDGSRVGAQIVMGTLGGIVSAAALAAGLLATADEGGGDFAGLAEVITGVLVGYPLGAAGGAYLMGNTGGQTGAFWATLGESAAGAGLGGLMAPLTGGLSYLVLVPLGATHGFNLTRRCR